MKTAGERTYHLELELAENEMVNLYWALHDRPAESNEALMKVVADMLPPAALLEEPQ